jgi:predicted PhzF superfamily epimerase YddE/YHI9
MAQVKSYRYAVVDVFTTEPLAGNPLAVGGRGGAPAEGQPRVHRGYRP